MGALSTGLPTHHHDRSDRVSRPDVVAIGADRHAHGSVLVEQGDKLRTDTPPLAVASFAIEDIAHAPTVRPVGIATEAYHPTERSPPPSAPRAPPYLI